MLKKILLLSISLIVTSTSGATAAGINDLSHIHNIKVLSKQIFFGTHEGLYHYKNKNDITAVGQDRFDIMGLNISENIAVLAQSRELVVVAAGSTIFTSSDNGKSFQTK
jgi:hypothetical protein